MPSLPPPQTVGLDILEEPHALGDDGGRNFSPLGTVVRTPPFSTSVVTLASVATPVSGMTNTTVSVVREGLMLRTYSDMAEVHALNSLDKANIRETAKKHLVGVVKFVLPDKTYPSFWQPDLLNNTPSYVDAFFDTYGTRFKDRKIDDRVLVDAVRLWKAAAPKLKKDVDNHRASVAQRMKADVMVGELLSDNVCIIAIIFIY